MKFSDVEDYQDLVNNTTNNTGLLGFVNDDEMDDENVGGAYQTGE